jgi:hypothetical protein
MTQSGHCYLSLSRGGHLGRFNCTLVDNQSLSQCLSILFFLSFCWDLQAYFKPYLKNKILTYWMHCWTNWSVRIFEDLRPSVEPLCQRRLQPNRISGDTRLGCPSEAAKRWRLSHSVCCLIQPRESKSGKIFLLGFRPETFVCVSVVLF